MRAGETAFERVQGMSTREYRQWHPEANVGCNTSMSERMRQKVAAVRTRCSFPATGAVVDVGGSRHVTVGGHPER